jgi:hypothetical protein
MTVSIGNASVQNSKDTVQENQIWKWIFLTDAGKPMSFTIPVDAEFLWLTKAQKTETNSY